MMMKVSDIGVKLLEWCAWWYVERLFETEGGIVLEKRIRLRMHT